MAEDDMMFDPSTKKKKKGKKKPFDLDAALAGEEAQSTEVGHAEHVANEAGDTTDKVNEEGTERKPDAGTTDEFVFDPEKMKKKKKKKTTFDMSGMDEALPASEEKKEEEPETNTAESTAPAVAEDMDFGFPLKKKKTRKPKPAGDATTAGAEEDNKGVSEGSGQKDEAWIDSDRDYTYDELLGRVFDIMREKNPEMVAGEKKRFVMKPPQVMKAGTKKTAFSNFADMCKMLHRQPKHLLAFLLAELGTSGSLDSSNQLIIKGRFQQKQIENVLRRYIKEYVTCHTCRSPDTSLQRDTRLYFLQCETCGSRCSVASIKSGFQAVTAKRAALRAKTT